MYDWRFARYQRNACVGEWVLFYPAGKKSERPVIAVVTEANDQCVQLNALGPRNSRYRIPKGWSRHIDDPWWDSREHLRAPNGAWDFHPVYGPVFTKQLAVIKAQEEQARLREARKDDMDPDDFKALEALEIIGKAEITNVAKATDLTVNRLKQLPHFMARYRELVHEEWEAKQEKSRRQSENSKKRKGKSKSGAEDTAEQKETAEAGA